jgi:hypothetical protein
MMISHHLRTPTNVLGNVVNSFEDAAYIVRQHIIKNSEDDWGRRIVHKLREAKTIDEASRAEASLLIWLGFRGKFVNPPQCRGRPNTHTAI